MTGMTTPKGPLPARVYWVRRSLVLLVALLLVFGIGKGLSALGGNDASGASATTSAHESKAAQPTSVAQPSKSPGAAATSGPKQQNNKTAGSKAKGTKSKGAKSKPAKLPASTPTGPCDPSAITVSPSLGSVDGGSATTLPMVLTTSGQACTWGVSAKSLVVKITSGSDRIWTSQDCPAAVPDQSVVVRPVGEKKATVRVTWSGRRSHAGCTKGTAWADPGFYHVVAAALGGSPTDLQFTVDKPPRPTVTKTAHPKQHRPKATKTPEG